MKINSTIITCLAMLLFASCEKEDTLAFDVIESPVLAEFSKISTDDDAMLIVEGSFSELDKSGILDQNVGIKSTMISGLQLTVFVNGKTEISQLSTDGSGKTTFEYPLSDLEGVSRLEWAGSHNDIPFRIYYNF